jgi:hypothetical protein
LENIQIIKYFESVVKNKNNIDDNNFVSIIKPRERTHHIKLMFKKQKNKILIDNIEEIQLDKLSEYHKLDKIYDIVIKPEILWELDNKYGIVFYLCKINIAS